MNKKTYLCTNMRNIMSVPEGRRLRVHISSRTTDLETQVIIAVWWMSFREVG